MKLDQSICEEFMYGDICLSMRGEIDWDNHKTRILFDFIGIQIHPTKSEGYFYVYNRSHLQRRLYSGPNNDKTVCIDDFFNDQPHEVLYISVSAQEHERLLTIEKKYNEILKAIGHESK